MLNSCAVALVLLLDISGSISFQDWIYQRDYTAAALASPEVTRAIVREEGVAISVMGFDMQGHSIVSWRLLRTEQDVNSLADEIRSAERPSSGGTHIGQALTEAMTELDRAPCAAERQVIDLSTDGEADPDTTEAARDTAINRGTTINAIAVGPDSAGPWLRAHAVTPDGFVMETDTWQDYPLLLRRKLVLELALIARP